VTSQCTCAELVGLVKEHGPGVLDGMGWLSQVVDVAGAAEFTGLKPGAVRSYHSHARRKRAAITAGTLTAATAGWLWPEPNQTFGGRPTWTLRTLVLGRAAMPGRGAGGGRPWHKAHTQS
jgi:hypothetical protein